VTLLVRATELVKRPVVTLAGEDVAQIKDVLYDAASGAVSGFTLNGRGIFAGPLKHALPMTGVTATPS
jgi:sporulation protein YlmC with PRC-barrel domain